MFARTSASVPVSQFARVAHELRTPVSVISGSLENLQESLATLTRYVQAVDKYVTDAEEISRLRADLCVDRRLADTADLLAICAQGAQRLRHVIEQLRSATSAPTAAAGQGADLRAVVDGAVAMVVFGRAAVPAIVCDFQPAHITVAGNPQSLGQVFLNLLRNALEALDGRPDARIEIEARLQDDHCRPQRALICLRDNGPGIAAEHRERVFDEFFSTKSGGGGLGLGLPICREILASMGGSIRLLDTAAGAAFLVSLPAGAAAVSPDSKQRL